MSFKQTIKCKKCGTLIEISDALKHQIEEEVVESALKAASVDSNSKIASIQKEKEEEHERNKKLTSQIGDLLGEIRKLRYKDEEREIEMKKKMLEEEEKISSDARKKALEEHELTDKQKDKKLSDALEQIEKLKTKMQQGSQQTQGETLELEIEARLRAEFPNDKISEVKKGQRGADSVQEVVDKLGRVCGTILWETKNAKWSLGWIPKLKEDQRRAKADLAVLVSVNLPDKVETFAYREGVWVVSWQHYVALAWALRFNLVSLYHERQGHQGKDEKMKTLYEYLTGTEFKHRIEGIIEAFGNLQDEIEREKRWFNTKWARQEKELRKVMDHTHGMYGDLQGVVGKSLPEIKTLELQDGEN